MARTFDGDAANYLSGAATAVSAEGITLAAWVYLGDNSVTRTILASVNTGGANGWYRIYYTQTSNAFAAQKQNDAGTAGVAVGTTTPSLNTWYHVCGVFSTDTARDVFTNGADKQSDTTNVSDPTPNKISCGILDRTPGSTATAVWSGRIAWPCAWTTALSDAEVLALARGAHPLTIRPESIFDCWDFTGASTGGEVGWKGNTLSETGVVGSAESRPVSRGSVVYVNFSVDAPAGPSVGVKGQRMLMGVGL